MRLRFMARRQPKTFSPPKEGATLRASLLCILVIVSLTLCLLYGIPILPSGARNAGDRHDSSKSRQQVSGLAELVSQRWASARVEVIRALKALSAADSPSEALEQFNTSMPARLQSFDEVDQLADSTLLKLFEKQREMNDPHYQSLLPPEVIPELAQAIRDHIRAIERIQNETRTLRTQTFPDIQMRLKKLTEAVRIKKELSGQVAAQKLWQTGVNEITTTLSGG
jgi:hypothetical protein